MCQILSSGSAGFLFSLLVDPEDGRNMFLRNVSLSRKYMKLQPLGPYVSYSYRCENRRSKCTIELLMCVTRRWNPLQCGCCLLAQNSLRLLPAHAYAHFVHLADCDYILTLVLPTLIPKVPNRRLRTPQLLSVLGQVTEIPTRV
jgi:hypothetical protein